MTDRSWTSKNIRVMRALVEIYGVTLTVENVQMLWLVAGLCDVFEKDPIVRASLLRSSQ